MSRGGRPGWDDDALQRTDPLTGGPAGAPGGGARAASRGGSSYPAGGSQGSQGGPGPAGGNGGYGGAEPYETGSYGGAAYQGSGGPARPRTATPPPFSAHPSGPLPVTPGPISAGPIDPHSISPGAIARPYTYQPDRPASGHSADRPDWPGSTAPYERPGAYQSSAYQPSDSGPEFPGGGDWLAAPPDRGGPSSAHRQPPARDPYGPPPGSDYYSQPGAREPYRPVDPARETGRTGGHRRAARDPGAQRGRDDGPFSQPGAGEAIPPVGRRRKATPAGPGPVLDDGPFSQPGAGPPIPPVGRRDAGPDSSRQPGTGAPAAGPSGDYGRRAHQDDSLFSASEAGEPVRPAGQYGRPAAAPGDDPYRQPGYSQPDYSQPEHRDDGPFSQPGAGRPVPPAGRAGAYGAPGGRGARRDDGPYSQPGVGQPVPPAGRAGAYGAPGGRGARRDDGPYSQPGVGQPIPPAGRAGGYGRPERNGSRPPEASYGRPGPAAGSPPGGDYFSPPGTREPYGQPSAGDALAGGRRPDQPGGVGTPGGYRPPSDYRSSGQYGTPSDGPSAPDAPQRGAPNHGALNHGALNHRAPNHRAPNHGAPNHGAPNHGAPNHGAPSNGAPNQSGTGSYGAPETGPFGSYRQPGETGPGAVYGQTAGYPRPAGPGRPGSGPHPQARAGEYRAGEYRAGEDTAGEYRTGSPAPANGNGNGYYGDPGYPGTSGSTAAFGRPGGYGPGDPPAGGPGTVPGRAGSVAAGPQGWAPGPAAGAGNGLPPGEPGPDEGRSRRRRRGAPEDAAPGAPPQDRTPWVLGGPEPGAPEPGGSTTADRPAPGFFDDPGPGGPGRSRSRPSHVPGPGTEEDPGWRSSRGRRGSRVARGAAAQETFLPGFGGGGGGDGGSGPDAPPPRRKRRLGRLLAPLLAIVLLVGLAGGGLYIYRRLQSPDFTGAGYGEVTVQVKAGDSASSLAPLLVKLGVVASQTAFISAAKKSVSNGGANLEPGFFALHKHMKAALAWAMLLNPKARLQTSVTVPDGLRLTQILSLLAKKTGFPLGAYQAAAKQTSKLGLPSYAHGNLEGYLYPATYPIQHGTSALSVLQTMVARYNQEAASLHLASLAAQKHTTPGAVITVASLLEAEGGSPTYYGRVARVIYNRLNHSMKLQLDSTVLYALHKFGFLLTPAQQNVNSPYNTFRHFGLPPGPIGNPGESAIEAALHPAAGNWIYFVTVNPKTGLTKFTSSAAQFQKFEEECHANGAC